MIENLNILRQAGFFEEYKSLTDVELIDILKRRRKEDHSKLFGYDYEPDDYLSSTSLVSEDDKKFLDIDLEAGVMDGNDIYVHLLQDFARASNGYFNPTSIKEEWESDEGPIKVSFSSNGQVIIFKPEYIDDWIDGRVFDIVNEEMKKVSNESFIVCSGPDDDWLGQNIIHIRLTEEQKELLIKKMNWNFPN